MDKDLAQFLIALMFSIVLGAGTSFLLFWFVCQDNDILNWPSEARFIYLIASAGLSFSYLCLIRELVLHLKRR